LSGLDDSGSPGVGAGAVVIGRYFGGCTRIVLRRDDL
jgi:hypothetical protein